MHDCISDSSFQNLKRHFSGDAGYPIFRVVSFPKLCIQMIVFISLINRFANCVEN